MKLLQNERAVSKPIAAASEGKTTRGASSTNSLPVCGGLKDMVLVIFNLSKKANCFFAVDKISAYVQFLDF